MRNRFVLAALFATCVAAAPSAQIPDGSVLVSQLRSTPTLFGGEVWVYNATAPTPWTSLNPQLPNDFPNWVAMDAGNMDLLVPYVNATTFGTGLAVQVLSNGTNNILASMSTGYLNNLDLDFDGTWLGAGGSTGTDLIAFVNGPTPSINTLYTDATVGATWNELAIDRDPGGPDIVIARFATSGARLFSTTRAMTVQTINSTLNSLSGVELIPETGQYLCCGFATPGVAIVNKDGTVARSITVAGANGAHINKDGTAWIIGGTNLNLVDYNTGTITSTTTPTNLPATRGFAPSGVEVYGSRQVTCLGTGAPGSDVNITVSSRNPADSSNAGYQLACSFGRRPALSIPGSNDMLCLAPDALFQLSVSNTLPGIFQNFTGTLNAFGNANATVKVTIPASLPANLGLVVFVSGVSFGTTGINSVFNTHWFEIN